jgi:hypothetical protein
MTTNDPALTNPASFALYTVRFGCELASLAAFFVAGLHAGGLAAALLLPAVAGFVWGRWMAPKSARRLADPARLVAEIAFFGAAAAGVAAAGHPVAGAVLGVVAVADALAVRLPAVTT